MIKPTGEHVLLEPEIQENTTNSGIVLTNIDDKSYSNCKVLAIGSNKLIPVNINDSVIIKITSGSPIYYNNKNYIMVKYSEILAVDSK